MSQLFTSGQSTGTSVSPCLSNEYSGLISFGIDWFDLLAVQGTLKSLLQYHSSKASVLQTIPLTRWTFVGKVMSLLFNMLSRLVIWSYHFMGNRWGNSGNGGRLLFWGAPKSLQMVTAASRHLLLGRKAMNNIDSILKSRDITLPTKVHLIKAMVFPVVMYGCESWTVKKAEC